MTDHKTAPEATHLTVEHKKKLDSDDCNDLPPPPDGGYGWVVVVASFMCNMVVDGIGYSFGIFLTDIVEYYGESKGKTAWVGSLLTGMCMCAGPLASMLANKFGCRLVCIAGSLIASAAFVLSIYSPSVNWLMLIYGFIGGTGLGLIYLPAVVCVGYYFESKRSLATGIAVCGSGVGTFAFAPLATVLLEAYGWRGANLVFAGIVISCTIFGALMRPLEYPGINDNQLQTSPSLISFENTKTTLGCIKSSSHGAIANSITDMRKRIDSTASYLSRNIAEVENSEFTSKLSLSSRKGHVIQPLARKDVFYSGSIANLKEFQSQKSLANYRHSILNIPHVKSTKRQDCMY
ncbi:hypothetical protein NQ314_003916 [Rhamnusium bicolor]|uniref:Major facilitator superfamily (MFS) profile domain-containing protein n=1 Tax=Rhamnusium bicolor TaxID=1586634 RepID=A0AAV8ZLY9_9CUCU|nr:hypothetical protein NQ314_003916 [Rhamnusium bicolor]